MPFLSKLQLEAIDDTSGKFILIAPLSYRFGRLDITITVPAGFETDLASIPQILQNVFPVTETYLREAVLHDFLYSTQEVPRSLADNILLVAMAECGGPAWKRWAIWAGVRVGGSTAWNRHAKEKTAA